MKEEKTRTVPPQFDGLRLDACIAQLETSLTRSKAKILIDKGLVSINARQAKKASQRVAAGDQIVIAVEKSETAPPELLPKPTTFEIIHEDQSIIVINKPAGLCMYPGAGKEEETLAHGLLHHFSELSKEGDPSRPGIVHRLDKDTSGIVVIAKTDMAHAHLSQAFKKRSVKKTYLAICRGHLDDLHGTIDFPIGRHPLHRKKMSIVSRAPRHAITQWEVIEELQCATFLKVRILTGRTHQIRVHMAAIGHGLLGDRLYGGPIKLHLKKRSITVPRQMLHAHSITFIHPENHRELEFTAPIPEDMMHLITTLRHSC